MKIYWIKAQAPRRVLAVAKHLGIQAEFVEALAQPGGMRSADYLGLDPNAKAPTMVDGDTVLWESSAIMAYLCIKAGSGLWPARNPEEQVEVLRWLSWNDCHWAPEIAPFYFEHIVRTTFNVGTPDSSVLVPKRKGVMKWAKILDAHLAGKTYVALGRLTIADFQLASMAAYWRESEMPLEDFPNIVRWLDKLNELPAWADPWPAKAKASA